MRNSAVAGPGHQVRGSPLASQHAPILEPMPQPECSLYLYGRLPELIESGTWASEKKCIRVIAAYTCGIRDKWVRRKAERDEMESGSHPNCRHSYPPPLSFAKLEHCPPKQLNQCVYLSPIITSPPMRDVFAMNQAHDRAEETLVMSTNIERKLCGQKASSLIHYVFPISPGLSIKDLNPSEA